MGRSAAYVLIGIGVGFGFAWWQGAGQPDDGTIGEPVSPGRATLELKLAELQTRLELERYEREALTDELAALRASVEELAARGGASGGDIRERVATRTEGVDNGDRSRERSPSAISQTPEAREQLARQRQIDRFVAAGMRPDRAQWILQREGELEMEALQAQYDATQNGADPEEVANITPTRLMREELEEGEYETYLAGLGRPITVSVLDVLSNSPADLAGLRPGDEIVSYNGQRVFEIAELNSKINAARPGAAVPLEFVRDGQRIQVYVRSGPIGISGGGQSTLITIR